MGTNIQVRNPSVDDFWGKEGCNEILVLSRPDIIKDIHSEFFSVGCDVVETDTFGGARVVLAEYDLQDKVREINVAAAKIAKEVAQQFSTKDRPRFVAGSSVPAKLPSLGHIKFDDMVLALKTGSGADRRRRRCAADRNLAGLAQAKAALAGVFDAMKSGEHLPVTIR
jgi:5-methyltetrahydrofolate--homocysteine methyltransferase